MKPSPIILFAYNRPWHLRQTVEALQKNFLAVKSDLFIYSDGSKDVSDEGKIKLVRQYISEIKGFNKVHIKMRKKHLGLAESVISGVSEIIGKHDKVIVMEDDLVSSPIFLTFMNQALELYRDNKKIFSITGFNYPIKIPKHYNLPVYLSYRCTSWSWGTWQDRWKLVDWQVKDYKQFTNCEDLQEEFNRGGEDLTQMLGNQMKGYIDSWAIRWCYAHFKNKAYCLHPTISKIKNIGLDGSGTHHSVGLLNTVMDTSTAKISFPKKIETDKKIMKNFTYYFKVKFHLRIINLLKNAAARLKDNMIRKKWKIPYES